MVMRTRLNITLHVLCVSSLQNLSSHDCAECSRNPITSPYKNYKITVCGQNFYTWALRASKATTAMSQFLQYVIVFIVYLQLKFLCTGITSCHVKTNKIFMWDFDSKIQTIPVLMYNNLKFLLVSFGVKGLWVEIFYPSLTVLIILR